MIDIAPGIALDPEALDIRAARARGPGGQHVNKTSTAVELRFDVRHSDLPGDVRGRLYRLAGNRLTQDGVILLFAQGHRSQEMNRREVIDRLVELVRRAAERPKPRKATKASYGSKLRRLEGKSRRSAVKAARGRPSHD